MPTKIARVINAIDIFCPGYILVTSAFIMPRGGSVSGGGYILGGVPDTVVAGVVVLCLALAYFWSKRQSGMLGQFAPQVSGLDQISDSIPTLKVLPRCRKCNYEIAGGKICDRCGSCPQCPASSKCGYCQKFERQISLSERSRPCVACGQLPCVCPTATGKPVEKEPGIVRGVYAEHVVFDY